MAVQVPFAPLHGPPELFEGWSFDRWDGEPHVLAPVRRRIEQARRQCVVTLTPGREGKRFQSFNDRLPIRHLTERGGRLAQQRQGIVRGALVEEGAALFERGIGRALLVADRLEGAERLFEQVERFGRLPLTTGHLA